MPFTADAFFTWHYANAFERGGEIVVDFVRYPDFDSNRWLGELFRGHGRGAGGVSGAGAAVVFGVVGGACVPSSVSFLPQPAATAAASTSARVFRSGGFLSHTRYQ